MFSLLKGVYNTVEGVVQLFNKDINCSGLSNVKYIKITLLISADS